MLQKESTKGINQEIKKSKRRISIAVTAIALAAILLVGIIGFAISYQQTGAKFQYEMRDVSDIINNTFFYNIDSDFEESYEPSTIYEGESVEAPLAIDLNWTFMYLLQGKNVSNEFGYPKYPMVVGFYSAETGELIKKSGSMLAVNVEDPDSAHGYSYEMIDIEPYMDEESISQMRQYCNMGVDERVIGELTYYVHGSDNNIIPLNAEFYACDASYTFDSRTAAGKIKFSSAPDSDIKVETSTSVHDYFVDDKKGGKDYKIYQELHRVIDGQALISEVDFLESQNAQRLIDETWITVNGANYISDSGMGIFDNRRYYYVSPIVEVDGERGFIRVAAGHNNTKEALLNTSFLYPFLGTSLTIIGIALIAQALLKKSEVKRIELDESKRAFVSATAHELKTPLSIIQNQAECILENVDPEKNRKYVESIYDEAKRMDNMVRTIQQYDRLGADTKINMSAFDLADLVREETKKYQNAFDNRGIELDIDIPDGEAEAIGDEGLIALVIDNFLSNAAKYTDEGGCVKVTVTKEGKLNRVSVYNTCRKFTEDELAHIWDMLYRGDKSRSGTDSSGGMGLAICKRILDLHASEKSYGCRNIDEGVEFYFHI